MLPRRIPRRLCTTILVAAMAALLLFALREGRRPGGDTEFAQSVAARPSAVWYARSPLTVYLHQTVFHFVFRPLGRSPSEAVAVCSAVAGGIFVAALVAISHNVLFLLFTLTAPFMFIFLGHVENYAWVNALLAVYFVAVKRHLEDDRPLWPALVWLLLAASFHMLAVFYAPSFFVLLARRDPVSRQWSWRQSRRERERMLVLFIAWALGIVGAQLLLPVSGLDNGLERLVPLFKPNKPTHHHFTFFAPAHFRMWLYFHLKASPLGLLGLILLWRWIRTSFERFLLVAIGCGFFWTWIWHPDFGERDWDLFANLALPLNILVGLLLARLAREAGGGK